MYSYCMVLHLPFVLILFFDSTSLLRALPSFPTRRSSDLKAHVFTTTRSAAAGSSVASMPSASSVPTSLSRSEEHTSELQSPCNLVCRLLLEKKKKIQILPARDMCCT